MIRSVVFAALLAGAAAPALAQPPATTPAGEAPPAQAAPPTETVITPNPQADIVANLQASGRFTTLLKALQASGLTPLLQRPGNFTLFAPTDAAFAALPPDMLAGLMAPGSAAKLQALLAYHLVNTRIPPDQILGHAPAPVTTVVNKPVTLSGETGVQVNGVPVLQAGVPASNGLIYVIGQVLQPPA